jgi:hypothetical protein
MKTAVARGFGVRVQIRAIDLTGPDVPESIRSERPTFAVYVLQGHYHKSTAFTVAGRQVYCGTNGAAAWDAAAHRVGTVALREQVSLAFRRYLLKWGQPELSKKS